MKTYMISIQAGDYSRVALVRELGIIAESMIPCSHEES